MVSYSDASIAVGLSNPNVRVSLHRRGLRFAQRCQILHVVVDILDRERQNFNSHTAYVGRGDFSHQGGELISVLVHLFDREGA